MYMYNDLEYLAGHIIKFVEGKYRLLTYSQEIYTSVI